MLTARFVACVSFAGASVLSPGMIYGQEYPSKTVRIVSATAGSASDFTARQIAQAIAGPLGQPVIVDNRAGGIISAEVAAKSPPDR